MRRCVLALPLNVIASDGEFVETQAKLVYRSGFAHGVERDGFPFRRDGVGLMTTQIVFRGGHSLREWRMPDAFPPPPPAPTAAQMSARSSEILIRAIVSKRAREVRQAQPQKTILRGQR